LKLSALILFLFLNMFVPVGAAQSDEPDEPEANPGRPTIATPATITPVGYLQFETGFLGATHSPEFSSRYSLTEVMKLSVTSRLQFVVPIEAFAHSTANGIAANAGGDLSVGAQVVVLHGEGAKPTVAASYFHHVHDDGAPAFDFGSPSNLAELLASADLKRFHFDGNLFFAELTQGPVSRGQFGQTISVSHPITKKFGLTAELWHFSQPFLQGNAIGNLWALTFTPRKNLVFDFGFNRGLTSTSTRWEAGAGFTYLLPHHLWKR
jgi:hypothetical protein